MDALTWAKSNPHLDRDEEFADGAAWPGMKKWGWTTVDVDGGRMSWEKAINRYDYTKSSKQLAYYTLGFVLHLLQDMGCSEHVHDDPHGDSGFHGFEFWVEEHWKLFNIDVLRSRPRRFSDPDEAPITASIDDFFINLSKIAYGISRFHGGDLSVTSPYVSHISNLAKMFDADFHKFQVKDYAENKIIHDEEWFLHNRNRIPIIEGDDTHANRYFSFNPRIMREYPFYIKGAFSGDWWPTHMEIPPKMLRGDPDVKNDLPGYYYLELSDETPVEGRLRRLYPSAFLPAPLAEVESQCRGWDVPDVKATYAVREKQHLYFLIGERIFPHIIEHTAGLTQLYYDIVNHPPYVEAIEVRQASALKYSRRWENHEKSRGFLGSGNTTYVESRTKEKDPRYPDGELETGPGRIEIRFSEPVAADTVSVRLGDLAVVGTLQDDPERWVGEFRIPADGTVSGELQISIEARDVNHHYKNEGGRLDPKPATPAKRTYSEGKLDWEKYEEGPDRNHSVKVKAHVPIELGTGNNGYWVVNASGMYELYWGTRASTENKYGVGSIIEGPLSDSKTRAEVLAYVQGRFTDTKILNEGEYNEMIVGRYGDGPVLKINRLFRLENGEIKPR